VIEERKLKLMKEQTDVNLKLNKILEANDAIFLNAGDMIAQGFEDAILSGQKLGEVVRSLGRDLVRLVFSQMVTQPLAAGIGGAIKGAFGFRAMGGPVSGGSPYVVGEQGPELFVPHASGTIVPNNKMGGGSGSGSGGVTVNYNIAAGVSRAELAPILEQERRRLKAEIPDMVRRGGGYRAAFA
jgi:phage-related minor tail protein